MSCNPICANDLRPCQQCRMLVLHPVRIGQTRRAESQTRREGLRTAPVIASGLYFAERDEHRGGTADAAPLPAREGSNEQKENRRCTVFLALATASSRSPWGKPSAAALPQAYMSTQSNPGSEARASSRAGRAAPILCEGHQARCSSSMNSRHRYQRWALSSAPLADSTRRMSNLPDREWHVNAIGSQYRI